MFACEDADLKVRSAIDGGTFGARRTALCRSEVFRDMFACCDSSSPSLDLHETSGELASLLRLLHDPPAAPTEEQVEDRFRPTQYDPKTIVPLPILRSVLFPLADKYLVDDEIIQSLRTHILAHASAHPLEVYGFATSQGWDWEASAASQFVLPMASYTLNEIAETIPSAVAYHRLALLQDTRVRGMRDLLLGEQIFPSGYGRCPAHHESTQSVWDRQRKGLLGRVECVSDIAGEMDALTPTLEHCGVCHKAWIAAVEMLRYKVYRLPRRLDQLK